MKSLNLFLKRTVEFINSKVLFRKLSKREFKLHSKPWINKESTEKPNIEINSFENLKKIQMKKQN